MSAAIILVTNENGKEAAVTIAANKEEARAVAGICKRLTGARFVGIDTMAASMLLCEAYGEISKAWEANPGAC